jgi:hypothetical protein
MWNKLQKKDQLFEKLVIGSALSVIMALICAGGLMYASDQQDSNTPEISYPPKIEIIKIKEVKDQTRMTVGTGGVIVYGEYYHAPVPETVYSIRETYEYGTALMIKITAYDDNLDELGVRGSTDYYYMFTGTEHGHTMGYRLEKGAVK